MQKILNDIQIQDMAASVVFPPCCTFDGRQRLISFGTARGIFPFDGQSMLLLPRELPSQSLLIR
jgi:hypothetical protein